MTAVSQLALVDAPRTPRKPRNLPLTAEERLRLFGHLSLAEKQALRILVDRRIREQQGIDREDRVETRQRCSALTGPFGTEARCKWWALSGEELCSVHLRRMAA